MTGLVFSSQSCLSQLFPWARRVSPDSLSPICCHLYTLPGAYILGGTTQEAIADGTLYTQPCWVGALMALGLWAAPSASAWGFLMCKMKTEV